MAEYINREAVYTAFTNAGTDVLERASELYYIAGFSYEHVIEILDNIPAANVVPKEVIKQIICGICNELHSEEPCEPADCAWMERLDNSIREVCSGNNE